MQQLCDRARIPLQDDAKTRYGDSVLLGYGMDGLRLIENARPDARFGTLSAPLVELVLANNFPLDDFWFQRVADYTSARARCRSSEEVRSAQTQLLLGFASQGVNK